MGNVQVKYKAMRGSHGVDDPVEKASDWFEALLVTQREDTLVMYGNLTDAQKTALDNLFDEGVAGLLRNKGSANGWLGEKDEEELEEI